MEAKECSECGSRILVRDYERAEVVCGNCGLVIEDGLIDQGPEWRSFDHSQRMNRSRVGAPMTYMLHDKGLSTMISEGNRDSRGKYISSEARAQFFRLRKWQRRIRIDNPRGRSLAYGLSEISRISSTLGLSNSVRETAAFIFREVAKKNLIQGRSVDGIAAVVIYAACRKLNIPRSLNEIAEVSRISKKEIARTYRIISRRLELKLAPTSAIDYLPRFCSSLGVKNEVQPKAVEIIRQATEKEITSGRRRCPIGLAAAAIYIASILCNDRRTQREVADASGVCELTLRNVYRPIAKELKINLL